MDAAFCAGADRAAKIDALWDFNDPARTEQAFRAVLTDAGDDVTRVQVMSQIARALGLQRRFQAAHDTLDEAERIPGAAVGLPRVRLLLERGRVFNSSRDVARATALFKEAFDLGRALGADFYAVDAAHMLGIAEPAPAGQHWTEQALELARSAADERARRWAGSLCNNLGWTHHAEGRYEMALGCFERALAERRRYGTEREVRVARWCVARCLRSLERTLEALDMQRALLEESGVEPDGFVHEEIAECLAVLGQPKEARGHFAAAYEALRSDPWLAEREPQRLQRLADLGASTDASSQDRRA